MDDSRDQRRYEVSWVFDGNENATRDQRCGTTVMGLEEARKYVENLKRRDRHVVCWIGLFLGCSEDLRGSIR